MTNLLLLYEIADKAEQVRSKKAFREFERWVRNVLTAYHDAAVARVANMHLFRLKELYGSV
jgi:hypothetical protein